VEAEKAEEVEGPLLERLKGEGRWWQAMYVEGRKVRRKVKEMDECRPVKQGSVNI
jgi:hypothetical protein